MVAHVPIDLLGTGRLVSTAENAGLAWKSCITGIQQVVGDSFGIYTP